MAEWRTGTDRGDVPGPRQRTIYGPDGELRGVMFATEDAKLVVRALRVMAMAEQTIASILETDYGFEPAEAVRCAADLWAGVAVLAAAVEPAQP